MSYKSTVPFLGVDKNCNQGSRWGEVVGWGGGVVGLKEVVVLLLDTET